jgi:hypothetical protein
MEQPTKAVLERVRSRKIRSRLSIVALIAGLTGVSSTVVAKDQPQVNPKKLSENRDETLAGVVIRFLREAEVQLPMRFRIVTKAKVPSRLILRVDMNAKGQIILKGKTPLTTSQEIEKYLQDEYRRISRGAKDEERDKILLFLQGHPDAESQAVFKVLNLARKVGFKRYQTRAATKE